ncbi:unnamed protein product [Paramecium octaurelia]|uniref:Uncharacterized protein n=1 Tax=Paramecium octaurelia TaxID=43137 RepID=A0A8S1UYJ7_PAROT|nr:unnamed protein product [Paramecium octaurelia]
MQYTQTQLEISLASFKDIRNNLKDEFQDYILQNNSKDKETPNNFGIILKELKNKNQQKQQQLAMNSLPDFSQASTYSQNYQFSNSGDETERLTKELEVQKSLIQSEVELKKSINFIKKQIYPLQEYANQLSLQQKQAESESKTAESESNRIKKTIGELQSSIARLKYQRQQYRDFIYEQSMKVEQNLKQEQSTLEQQNEAVENLVQTISKQKAQIEDLIKQQYEKMEKSEQQRITIQNYLTLTKLYEFCTNQIEQLNVNDNTQRISSESESSGKDDLYSDQEDSIITSNNFFQTQVQTSSQPRSKQRIATPKKKKKEKKKLTYPQLMEKFQKSKELLSKIKNDVDINIMEQFILNHYQEQSEIQRQLADQHQVLQESKDEYLHEIQMLNDKLNLTDDVREKLVRCQEPTSENFNQKILTHKIANTSNENELQIIKQTDKLIKLEALFFTLNTRAMSLLRRICSILQNIQQISEKLDNRIINVYQNAVLTVGLLRSNNELDLNQFPKFKKLLKGNNLTLIYCDQQVFQEFCEKVENLTDDGLSTNFSLLIEMCMTRIAGETQCIYEQISTICNCLKDEVRRLCNYGSLRSFRDLTSMPITNLANSYNAPTMRKLKEYSDSKQSEVTSKKSMERFEKKSLLADEFKFVIDQNEKSLNEDDIDEFYYQIKKEIEAKPSTKTTRIETANLTKTTLVYDQPQKNKMTEFFRSNSKVSQSLRRIQSQGQFIDAQSKNFRQFLEKEQKHIELLSRMNRTGSTSAFQPTTLRPKSQEKTRVLNILPRTISASQQQRSARKKIVALQLEKDMKRFNDQVGRFTKLKLN